MFRYGTMNSGKSIELLRVANNYEEQGKKAMLFTSSSDTRYGTGVIKSRIGIGRDAEVIDADVFERIEDVSPDCVLTDEAQFYSEHVINELAKVVSELNIPVICYGLKIDFTGHLFSGSKRLIELAHKIEEIKTMCWYTDDKATMNLRLYNGDPVFHGEQIVMGGNESYIPVCLKCYLKAKKKV